MKIKGLKISLVTVMVLAVWVLGGCARDRTGVIYPIYLTDEIKKVGIVLSAPEKSDSVLNHLILTEINNFTVNNDVEYTILEPGDLVNNVESLRYLAENEYALIIALGKDIHKDVSRVAAEYPDIRFALFEGEAESENTASLVIKENEGAFLAGAAAALLTSSNVVGYLGDPLGNDQGKDAFARGVRYINLQENKTVRISVPEPAAVTAATGGDYEVGLNLANRLYWSGADVVFSTMAKFSGGLADSARKNKRVAIMGDLGFLQANPWNIYGAVQINRDKAIYDLLYAGVGGKLGGGLRGYGVAEDVIELVLSEAVPEDIRDKLNRISDKMRKNEVDLAGISLSGDIFIQLVETVPQKPSPPAKTGGTAGIVNEKGAGSSQGTVEGNAEGNAEGTVEGTVEGNADSNAEG